MMVRSFVLATLVLFVACNKSSADATPTSTGTTTSQVAAPTSNGKREVAITANEKGFTPSSVNVKKGEPVTLVFKRTTDDTCAREVVFPELKITKELPLNQPVAFEPPVGEAKTLTFQCGMGMFKGKIVVQ